MYTAIARAYDKLMKDFDYDAYYNFVSKHISGITLELAVGSGEFTTKYIANVPRVIGVDISEDMLNIAVNKLRRHRAKLILLNEDMSQYLPDYRVDTVLSVCDGFNYVQDLQAVFAKIYKTLNANGKFIFDISTDYKLTKVIGNNLFYEDRENITYFWTNSLGKNFVDMEISFFTKQGDLYSRRDERHRQYIHRIDEVLAILKLVGFSVKISDGETFSDYMDTSNRVLFVCEK